MFNPRIKLRHLVTFLEVARLQNGWLSWLQNRCLGTNRSTEQHSTGQQDYNVLHEWSLISDRGQEDRSVRPTNRYLASRQGARQANNSPTLQPHP